MPDAIDPPLSLDDVPTWLDGLPPGAVVTAQLRRHDDGTDLTVTGRINRNGEGRGNNWELAGHLLTTHYGPDDTRPREEYLPDSMLVAITATGPLPVYTNDDAIAHTIGDTVCAATAIDPWWTGAPRWVYTGYDGRDCWVALTDGQRATRRDLPRQLMLLTSNALSYEHTVLVGQQRDPLTLQQVTAEIVALHPSQRNADNISRILRRLT